MPRTLHSADHEQVAHAACAVSELLQLLWGRGQEAAPSGPLSPSQLRALTALAGQEGVNLRALGEVLGTRPSSVSRLCDRLEAAGFVERYPSTTSRREIEVHLSRRGRAVLAESRAFRAREVETVLQQMTPANLAALAEGLEAFKTAAAHLGLPVESISQERSADIA
ncbi:MarR family transcriptional regulator [Streptomyces agglomeratus]|uniref:MarR family winged helix-turn-helix transcriptional regulator n=1 Tax=Streptomyces agglomeratus TaxID=285458 RepID=UPI000852822B|nr:MarR family transcriptional regulator [Streptomyces agglomeratus]OEJ36820.1 MarR family transcriptional regulator [Streptomyces agglomeratus]OEJ36826.1 MarR family transcriptional regulator [Streptomyces agglomeratus]OEJ42006.1 MarR family transcriptional regulator [Streptomyces agglomeratus]OEJ43614.1 MarR family transcriptional regulator [Streptomyces agglomeratus]OEJ61867.1 MarR family transcriptional regulator [Streptomyces agglomeratus]